MDRVPNIVASPMAMTKKRVKECYLAHLYEMKWAHAYFGERNCLIKYPNFVFQVEDFVRDHDDVFAKKKCMARDVIGLGHYISQYIIHTGTKAHEAFHTEFIGHTYTRAVITIR